MKMLSLFDGSGGFPLAGLLCGVEAVAASEIEPFPIRVTTKRFPNMRHLGDISAISGKDIEPVDIITFGSPCQDLSVAGKRAGLKHEENGDDETTRSGLFMEAVRIIKEMRGATNGRYPTFAIWENVPGAYSSNNGEDFRIVLEELEKVCEKSANVPRPPKGKWLHAGEIVGDGYSIAWRTFDAQYWGVPQRRRRIYLVADFRGERAGKILFERDGLRGNFKTCGTQGKRITEDAERGFGTTDTEKSLTPVCFEPGAASRLGGYCYNDLCGTLRATMGDNQFAVAYDMVSITSPINAQNPQPGDPCHTLNTAGQGCVVYSINHQGGNIEQIIEEKVGTLTASMNTSGNNKLSVAYAVESHPQDSRIKITGEVNQTLSSNMSHDPANGGLVLECYAVENHAQDCRWKICENGVFQTLASNMGTGGNNVPLVLENKCHIEKGNEEQVSPCVLCMATQQGGAEIAENLCPTITAMAGMSGNNQPVICMESYGFPLGFRPENVNLYKETSTTLCNGTRPGFTTGVICLQGNGIDRADTAGCNGKGWKEDISYTLNTVDRPAVCYSIDRAAFNCGENAKYDIGIDDKGTAHTIVARGPGAVAYETQCLETFHCTVENNITQPLKARDYKDPLVVCMEDESAKKAYSMKVISRSGVPLVEMANPICASDYKDPDIVAYSKDYETQLASGNDVTGCLMASGYNKLGAQEMFSGDYTVIENHENQYIVRRLTPLECCRLQGFPDWWCDNLETEEPTEEDLAFWREVFETHRNIVSNSSKPKSDKQIIKWLKNPYSDSAIYKMWGNGIALPNVLYVMQGVADELLAEETE